MIRVRVLGASEISIGHRRIGMNTEVLFALALYLTTRAGERLAREDLLALFWTKGTGEQRRHALRQLLYRLRQKGFTLDEDGEWILIEPTRVESDLRDALGDQWVEHASASDIDAAATLTTQFSRRVAPGFLEWLDGVRDRLASQHRRASLAQIVLARREGRWNDLERWAQSVLRSDPLNEEATLARAESAAMAGSKTIALEILDNYLQEVGEVAPELGRPAVLLRKRIAERRPDWATRGPKEVALIGRTELMSRLTGLVDAAWRGEGSAVILTGAPGIGKTRLAMEARAYAEMKGMRTVVVRAEAANVERPLAVVQEMIGKLLELPGAAGCDPESLQLVRKVTEHKRESPNRDGTALMASIREYLADSIRDLLDSIVHECRLLLLIDDLHHVDDTSHMLLNKLITGTANSRISWIASARAAELASRWQNHAEARVPCIRLVGLTDADSRALASAIASAHAFALSEETVAGVAGASAGNPLFVRELSLARGEKRDESSLPRSLSQVIAERLDRLPPVHLRVLRVIALLGNDATFSRLHRISGADYGTLSDIVEILEADGLLHLTELKTFALHECWQQSLVQSMQSATRAAISHECALALVDEVVCAPSPQIMWRTAELFAASGESSRAVELYISAASQLYAAGLPGEAAAVLERTYPLQLGARDRQRVLTLLAQAHMAAGNPAQCAEVSAAALRVYTPTSEAERDVFATCTCLWAEAQTRLNLDISGALHALRILARDIQLSVASRQLACLSGIRLAANWCVFEDIEMFHAECDSLSKLYGPTTTGALVQVVHRAEVGPVGAVNKAIEGLSVMDTEAVSPVTRCMAYRFKFFALRSIGRTEEAIAVGEEGFELATSRSLYHDAQLAGEQLAYLYLDDADCDSAERWLKRSIGSRRWHSYAERTISIEHVTDRLNLQRGIFSIVYERLLPTISKLRRDRGIRRRSLELATLAYCMIESGGDGLDALELLNEVTQGAAPLLGSFHSDYITELLVRSYRAVNQPPVADALAKAHVAAMIEHYPRPLPRFCTELVATRAALSR